MVNVLPEPVTPTSVVYLLPALRLSHKASMACGWSPDGAYFA